MIVKLDRSGANGTFRSSHYFTAFLLWTVILHADGAQSSGSRTFRSLGHEASVRQNDVLLWGFSFSSFGLRHRLVIIMINQPTTVSMRYIFATCAIVCMCSSLPAAVTSLSYMCLAPVCCSFLSGSEAQTQRNRIRTRKADNQAGIAKPKTGSEVNNRNWNRMWGIFKK